MDDPNTKRISVPSPSAGKPILTSPPPTASTSSIGVVITAMACLVIGALAGYFGHQHRENSKQYERYARELAPLIYYKDRVHSARERGSNETMRLVNFKIYQAHLDGLDIRKLLDLAQPPSKQPPPLAQLNVRRFLSNLELGIQYGIYEGEENLLALAYGRAPTITKGEYAGQRIDVEHIVPKSIAPGLDNILANLMWMPSSLNQSKSNTITGEALRIASIFRDEKILPIEEYLAVRDAYEAAQGKD